MLGIFFLHKKSETGLIQILITIMLMDYISTIFAQAAAAPAEEAAETVAPEAPAAE